MQLDLDWGRLAKFKWSKLFAQHIVIALADRQWTNCRFAKQSHRLRHPQRIDSRGTLVAGQLIFLRIVDPLIGIWSVIKKDVLKFGTMIAGGLSSQIHYFVDMLHRV